MAQAVGPTQVGSFERLYRRHRDDVYRYALGVLANRSDAEDVTQTAFLNAFRALARGQRPERPRTWLLAIARNACRQRFRQQARRPVEVSLTGELPRPADDGERPRAREISRALSQLPENQRAALVLRELQGRSYEEIGEALGVSQRAVETLLYRARDGLRDQLAEALDCDHAARAIRRQLDGALPRIERRALRAHLRACPECLALARRLRAQRPATRRLAGVPLPGFLAGLAGGPSGQLAGGVALKAAVAGTAAVLAAGAGYEAAVPHPSAGAPAATVRGATVHVSTASRRVGIAAGTARAAAVHVATTARIAAVHAVDRHRGRALGLHRAPAAHHGRSAAAAAVAVGAAAQAHAAHGAGAHSHSHAGASATQPGLVERAAHAPAVAHGHGATRHVRPAAASTRGHGRAVGHDGAGTGHGGSHAVAARPTTPPGHAVPAKPKPAQASVSKPAHPAQPAHPAHPATPAHAAQASVAALEAPPPAAHGSNGHERGNQPVAATTQAAAATDDPASTDPAPPVETEPDHGSGSGPPPGHGDGGGNGNGHGHGSG